jgi:hypothetical protein
LAQDNERIEIEMFVVMIGHCRDSGDKKATEYICALTNLVLKKSGH